MWLIELPFYGKINIYFCFFEGDILLKKLNIIHLTLLIIDLAVIPLVGFIIGFLAPGTFIAVLVTLLVGHPMIYLIMMLFKESMVLEYDTPRFMPLCMVLTILLGCVIWYLFFHLDTIFAETIGLWYGGTLISLGAPYVVVKIVEKITSNKKPGNGPKIIRNK